LYEWLVMPFGFISTLSTFMRLMNHVTPGHRGARLKIHLDMEKEQISSILFFFVEKVLFRESPPNIMITMNPNWSTEIIWYGTGYTKRKMLSPLKRPV